MNSLVSPAEVQDRQPAARARPRVSVLMPVYNGQRHLRVAVESMLNQTFTDFECIIIDDGSTDSTWEILSDYATWDQRIRLVRNAQNMGVTGSLNKGLELARGEYIARQDADDVSLPERFARQVQHLDSHPQLGLVGTWSQLIDEDGQVLEQVMPPTASGVIRWTLLFGNCFVHASIMLRQAVLKKIGPYDAHKPHAEDYDLWSRMSYTIPLANLPEVLVQKRLSAGRVSSRHLQAQEETAIQIMHTAISRLFAAGVAPELVRNLRRMVCGQPQADARAVLQVALFIRRLYRQYVQVVPLSRADKRAVARDAANRLFILAGQNVRVAPWASLLAVLHAERLDLRVPSYRTALRVLQRPARG